MINSTYDPTNVSDFEKTKIQANNMGSLGTIPAGTTASLDLDLTDDNLLTGLQILAKGSNFGDSLKLEVVDKAGTLPNGMAFPPNTVLKVFGNNIYLGDDNQMKLDEKSDYPAKVFAGLTFRVIYTSTGSTDVQLIANYHLHLVLV